MTIFTVTHDHKHGQDVYAFTTEDLALTHLGNLLLAWVQEWVDYEPDNAESRQVLHDVVQEIARNDVCEALNLWNEHSTQYFGWDEYFTWEEVYVSTTCAQKTELLAELVHTLNVSLTERPHDVSPDAHPQQ
jgi:hypothetical protein